MTMRTCQDVEPRLSEFADDDLGPAERADVSAHLATCADCSTLLADLVRIRDAATRLDSIEPPSHVWTSIAGQLPRGLAAGTRGDDGVVRRASPRRLLPWAAAAALTVTALGAYAISHRRPEVTTIAAADRDRQRLAEVAFEPTEAPAAYDRAIATLEAITRSRGGQVDPTVARTIATNLATIDRAIAESRTALVSSPDSLPARRSLIDSLQRKVDVLEQSVSLTSDAAEGDVRGPDRR
jgi:hypothetical protein